MPEKIPVFENQIFTLPDDLYGFQLEDSIKLQSQGSFLNFSEMGTGKTPESLAVCESQGYKRVLIICPNSLRWEWARQIKEWTGEDAGVSLRSSKKRLDNFFFKPTKYYVINYESFRISRYKDILQSLPWDCIIVDEGHKLKNPRTLQTKGVYDLCAKKRDKAKIMILTGSPIVNSPADLFTLLTIVKPEDYHPSGRRIFIDQYCYYTPTKYGLKIHGTKNLDILKRKTDYFTVRRTKKEVLPFLPDKYFRFSELSMTTEQREVYDQMEKELFIMLDSGEPLWAPGVLALLTRLRQLNLDPLLLGIESPSSKTEFLDDLVDNFIDNGEKLVIFSCFAKYIYLLGLKYKDIPHVQLTGEENAEKRAISVKRFQEDPSIKLCMGTIQAAGEGITLHAASNVILMDRWWNPAANNQAMDRLHRIGQKNAVQVIIPINLDSIDQSLSTILRRKEEFAAGYLGDSDMISEIIKERRATL